MYHLFAGQGYYPMSGLGDYKGPFETLEEAEAEGERLTTGKEEYEYPQEDWYSVIAERDGRLVELSSGWGKS